MRLVTTGIRSGDWLLLELGCASPIFYKTSAVSITREHFYIQTYIQATRWEKPTRAGRYNLVFPLRSPSIWCRCRNSGDFLMYYTPNQLSKSNISVTVPLDKSILPNLPRHEQIFSLAARGSCRTPRLNVLFRMEGYRKSLSTKKGTTLKMRGRCSLSK